MQAISKIFVIAGPSSSGKPTLLKRLFKEYPNTFGFSISHITRKPRVSEFDKNYDFAGEFIKNVVFSGNMYAIRDVVAKGKVCMLDIDMQGVQSRLRNRGTEKEAILAWLAVSKKEMEFSALPGSHDNVSINDELEKAIKCLNVLYFLLNLVDKKKSK
ncbi:P-loop containing nucleoside triphosphate hydrolase protein [Backusella circina FSU 941]|nr:P-loop containing nucleoside triphosphate hydrolase protein [Backusella circina FSU 941]